MPYMRATSIQALAIIFIAACIANTEAILKTPVIDRSYLTLDTGHMEVAALVADVLKRQDVQVTFFAANERTKTAMAAWATPVGLGPWWKARAAEGHAFAFTPLIMSIGVLTLFKAPTQFRVRPSAGPAAGRESTSTAAQYCKQPIWRPKDCKEMTGVKPLPLFRAPGGKTSPQLLAAAKACGYAHVGWATAGFLGDELPSASFSNAALLNKALQTSAAVIF